MQTSSTQDQNDLLWRHLKSLPAFRALLRAVEARFYYAIDLPEPTLDVGCGDGHFSQMVFDRTLSAGIDPWWNPLRKARHSARYELLLQSLGHRMPFADGHFASAFSNSVLEHIPDVQSVLKETNRVLQMDGRFVMTMPNHNFTSYLGGAAVFRRLGLPDAAQWYQRLFNRISRHEHTEQVDVWAERLAQAGFSIERWQYYFSPRALRALEWGHVQGVPSAILHALTGHWIVAPWESSLKRTEKWLRPFFEEPFPANGAYLLIVAQKRSSDPIPLALPAAQPFTIEELEAAVAGKAPRLPDPVPEVDRSVGNGPRPAPAPQLLSEPPPADEPVDEKPAGETLGFNWLNVLLGAFSLLAAILGQYGIATNPTEITSGGRWFGYSALALLFLLWRSREKRTAVRSWALPRFGEVPRRRWLYLPALLLAFLAQSVVATSGAEQPLLALILWTGAAALGFFAWLEKTPASPNRSGTTVFSGRLLRTAAVLFFGALTVRLINLTNNPFILNGIEASLGLNAGQIVEGELSNPFSTAWLTNPTLLLYLMAVPVLVVGKSILAIRILSPFVGALTVVATYVFGQKLFGKFTGLLAALLLAASHYHLHYSRLGMTNIWDGLLALLALGTLSVAWQRPSTAPHQRTLWLWAGVFVGLNAYAFTSSRVMPLILASWFVLTALLDWRSVRQQGRHLVAAVGIALIVALPLLLYYSNNPNLWPERANALGILPGQTEWLAEQAARSGMSQTAVFFQQFWRSALAFNGVPDNSPAYRPQVPLLGFGPAVFMVLGFFLAAFRLRQNRYRVLAIWPLATVIVAGALVLDSPQSHRLVMATPALALLAGTGLVALGNLILRAWRSLPGQTDLPNLSRWQISLTNWQTPTAKAGLVLLILVTLFSLNDLLFYFGRFPQDHQFGDANTEVAHEIVTYLNGLEGDWTAYLYGPPILFIDFPTFPYLLTDFQAGANLFNVAESDSQLPPAPTANRVFIFLPQRATEVAEVEAAFPGGNRLQFDGYYASPLFVIYEYRP